MAGTYIGKYDTTAANNTATSTSGVSVAEGMLPSTLITPLEMLWQMLDNGIMMDNG